MHPHRCAAGVQLLDHPVVVGRVQHGKPLALGVAQAQALRRIVAARIHPLFARVTHDLVVLQADHGLHKAGAEELLVVVETCRGLAKPAKVFAGHPQRRFVRRARQVTPQDVDVVRVQQRVLVRLAQQLVRVAHVVLVERIPQGDQHRQRGILAAARAAGLLPQAGDGAGIAHQQRRVQPAHVDAQFQRGGGRDAQQPAAEQLALDAPALLRQITGPIGRHALHQVRGDLAQPFAGVAQQQLRHDARPGERNRAGPLSHERDEQIARLAVGAAPG